jgi:hypothetical protein
MRAELCAIFPDIYPAFVSFTIEEYEATTKGARKKEIWLPVVDELGNIVIRLVHTGMIPKEVLVGVERQAKPAFQYSCHDIALTSSRGESKEPIAFIGDGNALFSSFTSPRHDTKATSSHWHVASM